MSVFREAVRCTLSLLIILPVLTNADRTPNNIQTLFGSACFDIVKDTKICSNGWTAFEKAFAGKNWNASTFSDYDAYFSVFPFPTTNMRNTVLFWTGTDRLQTALTSRANLISSANVVSITIINKMATVYNVTAWCGNGSGGIDYVSTNCPPYSPGTPRYTYYATFSDRLASNSAGVVFFLSENTFRNTSVFAQIELPRLLNNTAVTKIVVLNVYKYLNGTCNQTTSPFLRINKTIDGGKAFSCVDVYGDASQIPPSDELLAALTQAIIKEQTSKGR